MTRVILHATLSLDGFIAGQGDEMVPVLIGQGIRLFDHLDVEQIELEKRQVVSTSTITSLRFSVVK